MRNMNELSRDLDQNILIVWSYKCLFARLRTLAFSFYVTGGGR